VGPKTAVPFLAEMGSIEDFDSPEKLIAFAGLDLSVKQSGKYTGVSKLAKRGNRHLPRAIYLMTASVVSRDTSKAYLQKRTARGPGPSKGIVCNGPQADSGHLCHALQEDLFPS